MRDTYIPICEFIESYVMDGRRDSAGNLKLYELCEFQRQILTHVFTPNEEGRLPFQTVIISSPKKCLAFGERIWLTDGRFVECESLIGQEFKVWSYDEQKRAFVEADASAEDNGLDEVVRVTLKTGRVLLRTLEHPVYGRVGSLPHGDGWIAASDLEVGDQVALPSKVPEPPSPRGGFGFGWGGADDILVCSDEDVRYFFDKFMSGHEWPEDARSKFFATVGPRLGVYADCVVRDDQERPFVWDEVISVERVGKMPTVAITVPGYNEFLAHERSHNTGKTFLASCIGVWFSLCMAEDDDEVYVVSNAKTQSKERAYRQMRRIFERSPRLKSMCKAILEQGMETLDGVTITPISTEAGSIAGANPGLILTDELWAGVAGADERLFEELTPVHTRLNSMRLVSSYAGIEGHSVILERLYQAAMKMPPAPGLEWITTDDGPVCREDRDAGIFCAWTHERSHFPWCNTPEAKVYYEMQKKTLSHSAFRRLHENRWAKNEFGLDMVAWDECCDPKYHPPEMNQELDMVAAVDASYARDQTSVVSIYRKNGTLHLGPCATWKPVPGGPLLDLEETAEKFIFENLHQKFRLNVVFYDPAHMVRAAQALIKRGVRMELYKQTSANLLLMAQTLMDKLRYRTLKMPVDAGLRLQASSTSVTETPDGMKLEKGRSNAKVDSIVAMAMALVAAERRLPDFDNVDQQILVISTNVDDWDDEQWRGVG